MIPTSVGFIKFKHHINEWAFLEVVFIVAPLSSFKSQKPLILISEAKGICVFIKLCCI